ncbi:MAG: type I phosphomannose isomerase catalytic subunit [Opitutales bacterium]|jgi:mannose-6-phosphate isomerase
MKPRLLRFTPLYKERVWGGRALESRLGRPLPQGKPIGESWEIVDRPGDESQVAGGPWAGRTLRQIIAAEPAFVMGPAWNPARPFPILVKWLDARERMSLQVHPPAKQAAALGGEPKSESWYIAEAEPGAAVIAGLRPGVTRAQFEAAIPAHRLEPLVHQFPVRRGDSFFVHSGRIHAIEAGCFILEIQQNSDTTYRVYDWGRRGLDGQPRALHVAESLQCIDFNDTEPAPIPAAATPAVLADCAEFRLRRVPLAPNAELKFSANEQPRILSLVEGRLATDDPTHPVLERGANVLVPYASALVLRALESSTLLVTENFAH